MNIVIRKKSMFSQNIYTITNNDPGIKFLMSSSPSKNLRELHFTFGVFLGIPRNSSSSSSSFATSKSS